MTNLRKAIFKKKKKKKKHLRKAVNTLENGPL